MIISKIKFGPICSKRSLVLETAQIQDVRAIFCASDDWHGKPAQRGGESSKRTTRAALQAGPDCQARAWDSLERQRA